MPTIRPRWTITFTREVEPMAVELEANYPGGIKYIICAALLEFCALSADEQKRRIRRVYEQEKANRPRRRRALNAEAVVAEATAAEEREAEREGRHQRKTAG